MANTAQYTTAISPDISTSATTIAANISEDLTDIYQNNKDFVSIGQLGNEDLMNDALIVCLTEFKNYWGTKLLNAQLALHLSWSEDKEIQPASDTTTPPLYNAFSRKHR